MMPSKRPSKLERTTFSTSRLLEFCSEKELVNQTGHDSYEWPLVILKELLDNALDACEESGIAPEITVKVDKEGIAVADNGPGIPPETVDGLLDYTKRTSSREAYVSPCRGAQGNALQSILPMPFVLQGEYGRVDIASRGQRHEIIFGVDAIRREPVVNWETRPARNAKSGTSVKVRWPDLASR